MGRTGSIPASDFPLENPERLEGKIFGFIIFNYACSMDICKEDSFYLSVFYLHSSAGHHDRLFTQ